MSCPVALACQWLWHYIRWQTGRLVITILRAAVVYRFTCSGDPNIQYIGKTKRHLRTRINEHQKSGSAVYSHIRSCHKCESSMDPTEQFTVLCSSTSDFDLKILEALQIMEERPILNSQLMSQGSFYNLNIFWIYFFSKFLILWELIFIKSCSEFRYSSM